MYNSCPILTTFTDGSFTLPLLKSRLDTENEYIIFGDFNLYYFIWTDPSYLLKHAAAD